MRDVKDNVAAAPHKELPSIAESPDASMNSLTTVWSETDGLVSSLESPYHAHWSLGKELMTPRMATRYNMDHKAFHQGWGALF